MTTAESAVAIIVFVLAGILAFLSILHFAGKGYLINNAYIWASEEERGKMDKRPYYRQSAIVFCLLGAVFLVMGLSIVLQNSTIQLAEIPLLIGALVYAIVSSVKIEKRTKK